MAKIINISMPDELIEQVNRQAQVEDRPRSAIFREALRLYFAEKTGSAAASPLARPGSPQAVLQAFDNAPRVSAQDVDELFRSINKGKRKIRFDNPLKATRRPRKR